MAMKFPVILAALGVLQCVVALPTTPPLKQTGEAPGAKAASDGMRGMTGDVTNQNVPTSTEALAREVTPSAPSPPAKFAIANGVGPPALSSDTDKQFKETSASASDNTEKSDETSSTPTAKPSSNPTEEATAAGTTSQSRTSDQPLPASAHPLAQAKEQTTPQSNTPDRPLSKSESPSAESAQSTKPGVESKGASGKPKRAVVKSTGFVRPTSTKVKTPLVKSVGHLTNRHSAGHAARTEPTTNSRRSLPQTNAAFRAGSTATRKAATPTERTTTSLPKTSEHSRKTALHSQASTKTSGAARENRDGVSKVDITARLARMVMKPQLFAKSKDSIGAITKAPSKATPRPVLPEKDYSHAKEGNVGVSKLKRPTRAALPPPAQPPEVTKEASTTQANSDPSEKTSGQHNVSTSAVGKTGEIETENESTVNLNIKTSTSLSDVLNEMVEALISASESTKGDERSATGTSNYSGVPQSTDTVKTTPPTSTTQRPVCVTSKTTRNPSYQTDSSTDKARIIPGLIQESVVSTDNHDATTAPVKGPATTASQLAIAKSATHTQSSSERVP
ncbi:Protein of unknown function [Gryllus bimaculatus]|nr:Protein of unknown function [Gryllus bimaculatus]